MAVNYKPSKFATVNEEESLTEQEHLASCDINVMIKNALRGMDIKGSPYGVGIYGFDDLTNDGLQHRINKQKIEDELTEISKTHEFTEDELKAMPPDVRQKFKFKQKAKAQEKTQNKNDQTKKNAKTPPAPAQMELENDENAED